MKKDHIRDYATEAFRFYARMGCPTYKQAEAMIKSSPELADVAAVIETLEQFERGEKTYIAKAVKAVYFVKPDKPLESGDIEARVIRHSLHAPAAESSVYRWLRLAREIFAENRSLRM